MDDRRFDDLTRRLADGITRRAAVKGGALALLGALGLRGAAAAQVTQAKCGNKVCAANPGVCTNGCVCCVYSNGNSRCQPPGTCGSGVVVGPPTTTIAPTTTLAPTTPAPTTTTASPPTTLAPTTTLAPATTTPHLCYTASQDCSPGLLACCGRNRVCTQLPNGNFRCRENGTTAPPTSTTTTTAAPECVTAASCPPPSDQCQQATCTAGRCGVAPRADGTPCSDGNACTQADTCQAGSCVGGSPVLCHALDQCHDAGTCDPVTGLCSNPDKADGTACNDDNACTVGDTCQQGVCTGGSAVVCPNFNPCVTVACEPTTGCTATPRPAGVACPDFVRCDGNEVCDGAGNCVEGTPITCDPCTTCDPSSGTCIPASNGTPCVGDGNRCFGAFVCQNGACIGDDPIGCTPSDGCHFAGTCDPTTGLCSNPNKPNGSFCSDDNRCTSFDACLDGVCVGTPVDCDDGLSCTDDVCDPITGCAHILKRGFCLVDGACVAEGAACDDGNICTENDVCRADGVCAGTLKNCDDGIACTEDICDVDGQCYHILDANSCLIVGTCYAAGERNPEDDCRHCDPSRNQRQWSTLSGVPCGGDTCLTGATCVSGFCTGGETTTDGCAIGGVCYPAGATRPSNTCLVCDPERSKTAWVLKDNGSSCSGLCREDGTCQFGICTGGTVGGGFCEIDGVCVAAGETHPTLGQCVVCDPARNAERWSRLADDTPCTNYCEANATCQAGVCTGDTPVVCEQPADRPFCMQAVCDPRTGGCTMAPTPNARPDVKGCEVCPGCYGGVCAGTPQPVDCGACGVCDEGNGTCTPKPEGGDCGSDCATRRTCNASGTCVSEPGTCGLNIGCEARVCNQATQQCVETGANNGRTCGGTGACRACKNGTCQPKDCGRCSTCNPDTGECVPCATCCKGACGKRACGNTCCKDGEVCMAEEFNGSTVYSCCPQSDYCEGVCYAGAVSCCGRNILGVIQVCRADQLCCSIGATANTCCNAATEACGVYGCSGRP